MHQPARGLLLQHGTAKLLSIPPIPMFAELSLASMPGIAGIMEFFGGILIIVGLLTRPVAFLLSGMTAVAYFIAHAGQGFFPILNGGELAALYCFVFLYIACHGPGLWSVDGDR